MNCIFSDFTAVIIFFIPCSCRICSWWL